MLVECGYIPDVARILWITDILEGTLNTSDESTSGGKRNGTWDRLWRMSESFGSVATLAAVVGDKVSLGRGRVIVGSWSET